MHVINFHDMRVEPAVRVSLVTSQMTLPHNLISVLRRRPPTRQNTCLPVREWSGGADPRRGLCWAASRSSSDRKSNREPSAPKQDKS
jgi:hypothetical protein